MKVTHGWNTSRNAKPLCLIASAISSVRCNISPAKPLATKVPLLTKACATGFNIGGMTPNGVDFVLKSFWLVAVAWPVVKPRTMLLCTISVMSTFRLMACVT